MTVRSRKAVAALGIVALAFTGAACGGDSDSGSSSDEPATAEGLERTARSFADVIVGGDWSAAYDYLSAECHTETTRTEFVAETKVAMELAKAFGMDFTEATVTDVQVRDVTDTDGEVLTLVEIDGEPLSSDEEWEPWVYEDGAWRNPDCGMGAETSDSSDSSDLSGSSDELSTGTTYGGELSSSDEAQAAKELAAATAASIGETVELGDGVSVTVRSVEAGEAYGEPALVVTLRAENRGEDSHNPDVQLRCAGSTESSMITVGDSTYDTIADLPTGSYSEGTVVLQPQSGATCATPAHLWITQFFSFDEAAVAIPVDDAVIAQVFGA